ncbi:hypothetical protein [Paraburkholderia domus]|uniref:hypothetical protein n=1 Tax=Paraburkholderia domus TaxID=2793075 RepID=UPI001913E4CD|nr:hypothetical protein [Paraburkholderia domus]MBK5064817.1 hypothetical protein [Burkholderia sp. R-70199]CAE6956769.1 hypothetical protein R70199_07014 [Paraburkholderia domus]
MEAATASAWQLDFFGEATAVSIKPVAKPDPLPDPYLWSESIREQMVDALITLAMDSRKGDSMPESLMDCADLLSQRLRNVEIDLADYNATLGWVMGYWDGALPYVFVCRANGVDPETLQDVILSTPVLKADLDRLTARSRGTLI